MEHKINARAYVSDKHKQCLDHMSSMIHWVMKTLCNYQVDPVVHTMCTLSVVLSNIHAPV